MKFEVEEVCHSCGGTGLYVGMAERDGAAVVCHTCNGSGCHKFVHEYEKFAARKRRRGVVRVFEVNPGIVIGENRGEYALSDFGGIDLRDWLRGVPFPPKSENRAFTCPAWWYQSANYDRKPKWRECELVGSFRWCGLFPKKEKCWERFDREGL